MTISNGSIKSQRWVACRSAIVLDIPIQAEISQSEMRVIVPNGKYQRPVEILGPRPSWFPSWFPGCSPAYAYAGHVIMHSNIWFLIARSDRVADKRRGRWMDCGHGVGVGIWMPFDLHWNRRELLVFGQRWHSLRCGRSIYSSSSYSPSHHLVLWNIPSAVVANVAKHAGWAFIRSRECLCGSNVSKKRTTNEEWIHTFLKYLCRPVHRSIVTRSSSLPPLRNHGLKSFEDDSCQASLQWRGQNAWVRTNFRQKQKIHKPLLYFIKRRLTAAMQTAHANYTNSEEVP